MEVSPTINQKLKILKQKSFPLLSELSFSFSESVFCKMPKRAHESTDQEDQQESKEEIKQETKEHDIKRARASGDPLFSLKFHRDWVKPFREWLESLKEQTAEDIELEIKKEGLYLNSMDVSHIQVTDAHFFGRMFSFFEVPNVAKPIKLGLKVAALAKIFKAGHEHDNYDVSMQSANDETLDVIFEYGNGGRSSSTLKLLNIDAERLEIPEREPSIEITLPSKRLQNVISRLEACVDGAEQLKDQQAAIEASSESVRLQLSGDTVTGIQEIPVFKSDGTLSPDVSIQVRDLQVPKVYLRFSLAHMIRMAKSATVCPDVSIGLTPDTPIRVQYVQPETFRIAQYLAPKSDE